MLRALEIKPAYSRPNVTHFVGQEIQSLCLGMSARGVKLTARTEELRSVYTLLSRWLLQDPKWSDFHFTSITINRNHDSVAHRDSGNVGPSIARTTGDYFGGHLYHFPQDDGSCDPADFPMKDAIFLDTTDFLHFDGNQTHGVSPFVGERYSLIYFSTCTSLRPASADLVDKLWGWQH